MNTNNIKKAVITASAAAICVSGSWVAAPAQATTDTTAGGNAASSIIDIGEIVAMRKAQMAHDYVAYGAALVEHAAPLDRNSG